MECLSGDVPSIDHYYHRDPAFLSLDHVQSSSPKCESLRKLLGRNNHPHRYFGNKIDRFSRSLYVHLHRNRIKRTLSQWMSSFLRPSTHGHSGRVPMQSLESSFPRGSRSAVKTSRATASSPSAGSRRCMRHYDKGSGRSTNRRMISWGSCDATMTPISPALP